MQTAQLIVWEPTRQWVVHFRRLMATDDARIRQCRTEPSCDEMLAKWPASIVAVSVSAEQFGERLRWLSSVPRRFPHVRCIVLASPALREVSSAIRESGVVDVVTNPSQLNPVVEIVRRHLAQAPEPDWSPTQRILASLPWGD